MLEEMPPFPERESSILAKLKKKRPNKLKELEVREPKPLPNINSNEVANVSVLLLDAVTLGTYSY